VKLAEPKEAMYFYRSRPRAWWVKSTREQYETFLAWIDAAERHGLAAMSQQEGCGVLMIEAPTN